MNYSTSAIKESIQITNLAKNEIDEIKKEIATQNEKLMNIQKTNCSIHDLLKDNNRHIDAMFKKSKIGYFYLALFLIIMILLLVLMKVVFL